MVKIVQNWLRHNMVPIDMEDPFVNGEGIVVEQAAVEYPSNTTIGSSKRKPRLLVVFDETDRLSGNQIKADLPDDIARPFNVQAGHRVRASARGVNHISLEVREITLLTEKSL